MTTEMPIIDAELLALLDILPRQGEWNERDYLWISGGTNRLVELVNGRLEVLRPPTDQHQSILVNIFIPLSTLTKTIGGKVIFAALRLRLWSGHFRNPDILLLVSADDPRSANEFWNGADLVVEVVSPDKPERDTVEKVRDYAQAGIPEYWIVNPIIERISVLKLDGDTYTTHGEWGRSERATSALLPDFSANVSAVLDAE